MRSLLFIPADSEKKLAKGFASGADCLILDLEDSVAPEAKQKSRHLPSSRKPCASTRARAFTCASTGSIQA
ncbi:MAG: aldolase/citrate lyase family protein [Methylocella sp.]